MTTSRNQHNSISSLLLLIFLSMISVMGLIPACGHGSSSGGVLSHAIVLVTDSGGQPVAGATVWVPADAAALKDGDLPLEGLALTDDSGNTCADPPEPALFAACTGSDGIALLQCAEGGSFLLKFQKDANQGSTVGTCGQAGVVPASF